MDGSQFDTLLRSLTTARSRRGAVVGLLGGALGLLGLTDSEAKRKKKHHKKKGQGSPPPSPPASPPPPCPAGCAACQECQNGACVTKANDSTCNGDGRCLNGTCNPRPTCLANEATCTEGGTPCCSGNCEDPAGANVFFCLGVASAGAICQENVHCLSNACVGYRCQLGGAGADCLENTDCVSNVCGNDNICQ
jgi:hypothetical protein